jgi:23S rRNA pseudouridine2457 synthase
LRYIAFHKPYGIMSQFTDHDGHPGLGQFISVPGIYPVGRLDHDSEGLLLLTDDGPLTHKLSDPRYEHPKTYWVQVEGVPLESSLQALRAGLLIQGVRTRRAEARLLVDDPVVGARTPPIRVRKAIPTAWLEITLREGRNRQIRRMTAAIGHPTLRLIRAGIGPLQLGPLSMAHWRALSTDEIEALKSLAFSKRVAD